MKCEGCGFRSSEGFGVFLCAKCHKAYCEGCVPHEDTCPECVHTLAIHKARAGIKWLREYAQIAFGPGHTQDVAHEHADAFERVTDLLEKDAGNV